MKYEMILDFLINAKANPESLKRAQTEIEKALSNAAPKLNLDDKQVKSVMADFNKLLNLTEAELGDLKKSLMNIDLPDNLQKEFQNLIKEFENIDNINFDSLNKAIDNLDFSELGKLFTELDNIADNSSFDEQIKGMALAYTEAEAKVRQQLDTQKKALKQMELTGKTGTESYKRLKTEIAAAEKELNKLGGEANNTKTIMDKMATFGLAAQGIQQVADSLGMFTADYIGLDTATQKIKTLGGTAKELAPAFRDMAVEMSKNLPIAATDIANATYDALSAGINASEKDISAFMEASSKLAVGGAESVGNSVNVLSSIINAYGLKATEATKVSDELFTTINLGKTNLPELSASLSQVIPTAAGLGVEFKNVGASLALMTANGIPTAQATTKLNALFVEMQKPGADLTRTLSAAGVSVDSLKKQISAGDFYGALESMKGAFDKAGISATQAFSSVESGAAFQTLTKDMGKLKGTIDSFANSAGATENAYSDMSEGIENKMQSLKNAISNIFVGINDVFGSSFATTVGAAQQLAPIMITLQGIGSVIPADAGKKITEFATSIVNKLVPGLITQTAATEGAAAAQTKLNLKVLANPYVLAVAAIAALVTSLHYLSDALHKTAQERAEETKAEQEAVNSQIELAEKQAQITKSKVGLIESFEAEGEAAMDNANLLLKLSETYPGVIDKTKSYQENLDKLKVAGEGTQKELDKLGSELIKLDAQKLELDYKVAKVNVDVDKEAIEDSLTDAFSTWGLTDASEWLFGTSTARADAETLIKPFTDAIYKASNSEELNKAALDMQMAIWNNPEFAELDDKQKQIAVEKVQKMAESQSKVIQVNNEKLAKQSTLLSAQVKNGLISEVKAVEMLKKQYGLSDAEAKKLLTTQKDNTKEAKNLLDNVNDVVGGFEKAKTAAQGVVAGATTKALDYKKEMMEISKLINDPTLRPKGVTEAELKKERQRYQEMYDAEIKQGRLEQQNLKKLEKMEQQVQDAINPQVAKKEEQDYLAELQKQIGEKEKLIEQDKTRFGISQKQVILEEQRQRNTYDDYLLNQKNIELLNKQNADFLEVLKQQGIEVEKIDGQTEVKFSKKIGEKQKEDITNYVKDYILNIENELQNTTLDGKELTLDINLGLEEAERKLKEAEFKALKIEMELGVSSPDKVNSIVQFYERLRNQAQIEVGRLTEEMNKLNDEMNAAIFDAGDDENLKAQIKTYYAFQKTELTKNLDEQKEKVSNNQDEIDNTYLESFELRKKLIDDWYSKEKESLDGVENKIDNTKEVLSNISNSITEQKQKDLDKRMVFLDEEKQAELNNINLMNDMKLLSTKDIEQRKLDIENEFNQKKLDAQKEFDELRIQQEQMLQGILLEEQRVKDAKKYQLDIEANERELALLDEKLKLHTEGKYNFTEQDAELYQKLNDDLESNKVLLKQKGTELGVIAEQAGLFLQEQMGAWFSGDNEALKDNFNEFLGIIKGIIQKKITAFVLEMVLSEGVKKYLAALPFPLNVLSLPLITATIQTGIKAITDPLLNKLSFASGGVIDSPSLIQVGDASILGGENKEWIFRNDQLKTLVASIVQSSNNGLNAKIDSLINILSNQSIETRLKGEDIYLSMKRTQYNNQLRSY